MTISEDCWTQAICGQCGDPLQGGQPEPCPCCGRPLCPACAVELFDAQQGGAEPSDAPPSALCSECYEGAD